MAEMNPYDPNVDADAASKKLKARYHKAIKQKFMPRTSKARAEGREPTNLETGLDLVSTPLKFVWPAVKTGIQWANGDLQKQYDDIELRRWKIRMDNVAKARDAARERGDKDEEARLQSLVELAANEVRKRVPGSDQNPYSPESKIRNLSRLVVDAGDEFADDPFQLGYLASGIGANLAKQGLGYAAKDIGKRIAINAGESAINTAGDQGFRYLDPDENRQMDDARSIGIEAGAQFAGGLLGDLGGAAVGKIKKVFGKDQRPVVSRRKYAKMERDAVNAKNKLLGGDDVPEGYSEARYYGDKAVKELPPVEVEENGVTYQLPNKGRTGSVAPKASMDVSAEMGKNLNPEALAKQEKFLQKRGIEEDFARIAGGAEDAATPEGRALLAQKEQVYLRELEKAQKAGQMVDEMGRPIPPEAIAMGRTNSWLNREARAARQAAQAEFENIYKTANFMKKFEEFQRDPRNRIFLTRLEKIGDKQMTLFDIAKDVAYHSDDPIVQSLKTADFAKQMLGDMPQNDAVKALYSDIAQSADDFLLANTDDIFMKRARISRANAATIMNAKNIADETIKKFREGRITESLADLERADVQNAFSVLADADPAYQKVFENMRKAHMAASFPEMGKTATMPQQGAFFHPGEELPAGFDITKATPGEIEAMYGKNPLHYGEPPSPLRRLAGGESRLTTMPQMEDPLFQEWTGALQKWNDLAGVRQRTGWETAAPYVQGLTTHAAGMGVARDLGRVDRNNRIGLPPETEEGAMPDFDAHFANEPEAKPEKKKGGMPDFESWY